MSRLGAAREAHPRRLAALGSDLVGVLWISPWLVGFAAFMLLPIGMSLALDLRTLADDVAVVTRFGHHPLDQPHILAVRQT